MATQSFLVALIFLALCLFLLSVFVGYLRYRKQVDAIGGPPVGSLLLGNLDLLLAGRGKLPMREYIRSLFALIFKLVHNDSKGAFRLWLGPLHAVFVLTDVNNVERILSSSVNLNKGLEYRFLKPWLGGGILLAEAHKWRAQRKLATPAFHFKMLEAFMPVFHRHTALMLQELENKCEHNLAVIDDVRPVFENITLNIINETAMGVQLDEKNTDLEQHEANVAYREALKRTFRFVSYRTTTPTAWFDCFFRQTKLGKRFFGYVETLHAYTDRIIAKRLKHLLELYHQNGQQLETIELENKNKDTLFLDILLKQRIAANPLGASIEGIRSEVHTFILGGHDTTASALTCFALLLGSNLAEQEQARSEVLRVAGSNLDHLISTAELKLMRYLEQCIKETLRLYPSVLLVGRHLVSDLKLADNVTTIPAGHTCYVPIVALHRDARYFDQPDRFRPERFSPENRIGASPFSFVPFSAGPRNCIGQRYAMIELKLILAELLRRFRWQSITKIAQIEQEMTAVNKISVPVCIRFEKI